MNNRLRNTLQYLPIAGCCLFAFLHLAAAAVYPGGSEVDRHAKGFSWMHNYFCDLLETYAENGEPNTARPIAIAAMAVLCISLGVFFWYIVPGLFPPAFRYQRIIQYTGILSMVTLVFLEYGNHDLVISIAVLLGLVAVSLTLIGLYQIRMYKLVVLGLVCLLLTLLNNYIYYTGHLTFYLPVIQRITFFLFLLWFCLVTFQLIQQVSKRLVKSKIS